MDNAFNFLVYRFSPEKFDYHEEDSSAVKRRQRKKVKNAEVDCNDCKNEKNAFIVCCFYRVGNCFGNSDRSGKLA